MSAQFGRGDFDGEHMPQQIGQPESLAQRISTSIYTVQQNVHQIESLVSRIGTSQDSRELRDRLHNIQQETNRMVKETSSMLKKLSNAHIESADANTQAPRMLRKRLADDFTAVLNQFQAAQRRSAQAEKDSMQRPHAHFSQYENGTTDGTTDKFEIERGVSQTRQLLTIEQDSDLEAMRDREVAMKQIESNIMDVNEIFKDLAQLVHDQGTLVDSIEGNVEIAHINVEEGTKELGIARNNQKKSRRKVCILLLILFTVLAIILGIIVWQATK